MKTEYQYNPEIEALMRTVCEHFNTTKKKLTSRNRHSSNAYPRHLLHHLAYKFELDSLERIGSFTGRDHATVLHSYRKINEWSTYDKKIREDINAISNRFLNFNEVAAFKDKLKHIPLDKMEDFIRHINQFVC